LYVELNKLIAVQENECDSIARIEIAQECGPGRAKKKSSLEPGDPGS